MSYEIEIEVVTSDEVIVEEGAAHAPPSTMTGSLPDPAKGHHIVRNEHQFECTKCGVTYPAGHYTQKYAQLRHRDVIRARESSHEPELIGWYRRKPSAKAREVWLFTVGDPLPRSTFGGKETHSQHSINYYSARWHEISLNEDRGVALWVALVKQSGTSWKILCTADTRRKAIAWFMADAGSEPVDETEVDVEGLTSPVSLVALAHQLVQQFNLNNTAALKEAMNRSEDAETALEIVQAWRRQINEKLIAGFDLDNL